MSCVWAFPPLLLYLFHVTEVCIVCQEVFGSTERLNDSAKYYGRKSENLLRNLILESNITCEKHRPADIKYVRRSQHTFYADLTKKLSL